MYLPIYNHNFVLSLKLVGNNFKNYTKKLKHADLKKYAFILHVRFNSIHQLIKLQRYLYVPIYDCVVCIIDKLHLIMINLISYCIKFSVLNL